MVVSALVPQWLEAIREEQAAKLEIQQLIQKVTADEDMGPWELRNGFFSLRVGFM